MANRTSMLPTRAVVMSTARPGDWFEEFPYATTRQGGATVPPTPLSAIGAAVPWYENAVQGGLLSAFYRYTLKGKAGSPFLVVPIPL